MTQQSLYSCCRWRMLTMWITIAALLLQTTSQCTAAASNDVFYELRTDSGCSGVGVEGQTVDILCSITISQQQQCQNASTARIHWFFSSKTARFPISDGDKFGIWDETESAPGEVSSLLRIRKIDQDADTGIFTCSLTCETTDPVLTTKMELCVQDSATSLISCAQTTTEDSCTHVFANGQCDEHCDSEDQLFDGGDCDSYLEDKCGTTHCDTLYHDGVCQRNCSSPQCGFDGGDCLQTTQSITRETLSVVIPTIYTSAQISKLSQQISILLSTLVEVNTEPTEWSATDNDEIHVTYLNPAAFQIAQNNLTILQYQLVPQSCVNLRRCFLRVTSAAKYISHQLVISADVLNGSIAAVGYKSKVDACDQRVESISPNKPGSNRNVYNSVSKTSTTLPPPKKLGTGGIIGIALCGVALLVLIVGIIITCRYRKMAKEREKKQAQQKQSQVKAYLDTIPDINSHTDNVKTSQSSAARSASSRDVLVKTSHGARAHNYTIANGSAGAEEHV